MSRNSLCLNGEWDFMPVYGVKSCLDIPERLVFEKEKIRVPSSWRYVIPEGTQRYNAFNEGFGIVDDFQPFNMFEYPKEWNRADTGVYYRTFTIPAYMLEGRIFLRFDGIIQFSKIYLNNKAVAEWDEAYLPLRVDVTDMVKRDGSKNELIVVCTTFEEIITPSGLPKSLGLAGSWFGSLGRGIWHDVFLEACPHTYVEDVYVKTSLRNKTIDTAVGINNKWAYAKDLDLKIVISDDRGISKTFSREHISIKPGSSINIDIGQEWKSPELWTPDNPHLYKMHAILYENNEEIDNKSIRFGFREVWGEGYKFILNGTRINLRGDSWHYQGAIQQNKEYALNWYRMCKENGINFVRLHAEPHPECYLEAADEVGMLIIDETAIYGSAKSMPADHPVYLGRCKKHVERLIKRDKNHPSIIMWSLENEMRWVDGRDIFKLHIPEMIQIIKRHDNTRPVILEGDNRLISKENTEIDSYHYNIDGTIDQWERKHPLFFGEHGGWWYVCPQNSSAYAGLKAYLSFDNCVEGIALREKLYVEYARKNDVTGITSFNFVHYMMRSMPEEDIRLEWERLDTPGCKPKVIRKYSQTLNNGYLKDYPLYRPNASLGILKDSYKAVTIIPCQYNTSFFDDVQIPRSFDVYNDTLYPQNCTVAISIKENDSEAIYEKEFEFVQQPGERKKIHIRFIPPKVTKTTKLLLEAVLYHENKEKHRLCKIYKLYPALLKKQPLDTCGKIIAYWGSSQSFEIIKTLISSCVRVNDLEGIDRTKFDLVVIGSYVNAHADGYHDVMERYIEDGGVIVQLEQFKFVPGNLTISKQSFFSAHINEATHKILEGLTDDDLIFWKPYTREDFPENIIEACFVKPVKGDVNILLECSAGDFGDGGDLWTPLIEYGFRKGRMILNQLELVDNYYTVPQACVLLRNILEYALSLRPKIKLETALLASRESSVYGFISRLGLDFDVVNSASSFKQYKIIIVDMNFIEKDDMNKLYNFVKGGGRILALPVQKGRQAILKKLLRSSVEINNIPTYQLNRTGIHALTKGISICDLFRFEKVTLSPRLVENKIICEDTIEIEKANNLLMSVNGTPWYDYYVRNKSQEYSRPTLVEINKKNKLEDMPYLVEKQCGQGSFVICQISIDPENEKNIRIYSRLLSNMGAFVHSDIFSYSKGEKDYSVDYFMSLPHEKYKDYKKVEEYYSHKDFSLNNLGEGLYGYMKKVAKDSEEGFINIENSSGRTYFLSCFAGYIKDRCSSLPQPDFIKCKIEIDVNCSFKLWINGKLMKEYSKASSSIERITIDDVVLVRGLNRFIIVGKAGDANIRFRPVFKSLDGSYIDNIKYQLTVDEVALK